MVNEVVYWVSSADEAIYYTAEQYKYIFFQSNWVFSFGLVLTEHGFCSILDCIIRNLGGELILLIVNEKKDICLK